MAMPIPAGMRTSDWSRRSRSLPKQMDSRRSRNVIDQQLSAVHGNFVTDSLHPAIL
jgi:hypothetical protein